MDQLTYGDKTIGFETQGGEHDIIAARFIDSHAIGWSAHVRGYGMSRREAAIDLLRAYRDGGRGR